MQVVTAAPDSSLPSRRVGELKQSRQLYPLAATFGRPLFCVSMLLTSHPWHSLRLQAILEQGRACGRQGGSCGCTPRLVHCL